MDKRELFLKRAGTKTQEALRSRDLLLAHSARAIDELNKVTNLLHERLNEMYSLYLPDLEIKDAKKYAELASILESNTETRIIAKIVGQAKADQIMKIVQSGNDEFKQEDLQACQLFAQRLLQLYQLTEEYEKYEEKLAQELCPNIAHVAGYDIAAKLIARVGSLRRLSLLPASTIQVLGAEKALFKHLRNRKIDPPKHGIIFQHVRISSSPKKVRGKIARTLANKIALAAKADGFTKHFIAEKLKKDFDERYQEIMAQYEKEKEKKASG